MSKLIWYEGYSSVISPPDSAPSDNPPSVDDEIETKINTNLSNYLHKNFSNISTISVLPTDFFHFTILFVMDALLNLVKHR